MDIADVRVRVKNLLTEEDLPRRQQPLRLVFHGDLPDGVRHEEPEAPEQVR